MHDSVAMQNTLWFTKNVNNVFLLVREYNFV